MNTSKIPSTLVNSTATQVLDELYADAERQRANFRPDPKGPPPQEDGLTPYERYSALKNSYMPIDRLFGQLMYSLVRATKAKAIVEFGTSLGISTTFLAAAAKDNGNARLVTTEFIPEKAATAKQNLTRAGLADYVEFRVGDALETLQQPLPGPVDFVFLDGDKSMYPAVLAVLEPHMAAGCLVAADNTDHHGMEGFLAYLRDPANGYISTPVPTPGGMKGVRGHELALRL